MWVPLVESGELSGAGTDYFLHKYLLPVLTAPRPPTRILLGCTHYPLLLPGIRAVVPAAIEVLPQGELVAERLADWLVRHPDFQARLTQNQERRYLTTDDPGWFAAQGSGILATAITAEKVRLPPAP
jgi:glutamate racemase